MGGEAGWSSADAIETKKEILIRKKGKGQKISRPRLILDAIRYGAVYDGDFQYRLQSQIMWVHILSCRHSDTYTCPLSASVSSF